MRIMPISDSPWAPTGFGTNTKNISAIWAEERTPYRICRMSKS